MKTYIAVIAPPKLQASLYAAAILSMPYDYVEIKRRNALPRLSLEGALDLTYRCNNKCRHCWSRIASDSKEKKGELSLNEIKGIVDEARAMGCRKWSISGGEPMLRPDFCDIFDYITSRCASYSINTNGTLITSRIARLMKRKGVKMIALYGATSKVHDHITRNPGSFEATLRGFRYLKEAGAGFIVQVIPVKDNYHQYHDMIKLAQTLSGHYRIGAAWLYLSACGDPERNEEIARQRLPPKEVIELDKPDLSYEDWMDKEERRGCGHSGKDCLFSSCIANRRNFHIDPYGQMSFCCFVKEPTLRYDLRKGDFKECWEQFIPSLAQKVEITDEYKNNCGSCAYRSDCRWCPVYAYLEHRDFNKRVEYLCAVAKEHRKFKEEWQKNHRRYFKIADISIQVESDLPIDAHTFHPKFKHFEADGPSEDAIKIRHRFFLPDLAGKDLGEELYCKPPWVIYKKNNSWIYLGISTIQGNRKAHKVAVFNSSHTRATIYNDKDGVFRNGGLSSLTLFSTDQILLARILADRGGFYLHSCGVNLGGKGLLFAGHAEAGKSTIACLLKGRAEILCDDRMIVREGKEGFKIYGTWSHGDVAEVSGATAPLRAILFLEKAKRNQLIPLTDKKDAAKRILGCLITPFVTKDWWDKTLALIEKVSQKVPCYVLKFDKSERIVDTLRKL